jgi:ATP-binding cassette subfamily F protein 3
MASVVLQNVTKQFGPKVVLADVSLEIRTGETVGLVGANGAGKTTVFKLITGEEPPDLGTVTASRGLQIGMLAQEPQLDSDRTLHDEVGRAFDHLLDLEGKLLEQSERMAAEHDRDHLPELMAQYDKLNARFEAAGGYRFRTRLNEILGGLGFAERDHRLPVSTLSGGQKCRAALAKLLLQERQLLLLDEPTNHLDLEATRWLEKFLAGHHGGAVIVSHDRYLLNRLASKIIEVEHRKVTVYPGDYSNYVQAKEVRRLTRERQYEKDREFIEKERAFIAKHIGKQRSKEARGRRTRLERRIEAGEFALEAPRQQRAASFKFRAPAAKTGKPVLWGEELSKRYDDKALFENLDLRVWPGERLGITGPNGTGKTTLLRIVLKQVEPDSGTAALSPGVTVGYYDQEHADLERSRSVIDELRETGADLGETELRSFLARFLFSGDEVFKPIARLSGGEQSRVRLAKLVLAGPQLLILDEPTNHLDIPSREALEKALNEYQGTILVVSHDRYLLDRVVNRLLVLDRGRHATHNGNYSFYAEQLEAQRQAEERARRAEPVEKSPRRLQRRKANQRKQLTPYDGMSVEQLEELIIAKEQELDAVRNRFGDQSLYRDPTAAARLQEDLHALNAELEQLNEAWEQRAEQADS